MVLFPSDYKWRIQLKIGNRPIRYNYERRKNIN